MKQECSLVFLNQFSEQMVPETASNADHRAGKNGKNPFFPVGTLSSHARGHRFNPCRAHQEYAFNGLPAPIALAASPSLERFTLRLSSGEQSGAFAR